MNKRIFLFLSLAAAVGIPRTAPGESTPSAEVLTPARVVELARTQAPEVLVSETAVLEARGRLSGARVLAEDNPEAEILSTSDRRFDRRPSYELSAPLGFGLKRSRRIGVARAEVEREEHRVADSRRLAVGRGLAAYYRVLHAEAHLTIAVERRALAQELLRVAGERHRTGDAPRLEVNVAETELARAGSEALATEAEVALSRSELAIVLGFTSGTSFELAGDLEDRSILPTEPEEALDQRADVRAAESELRAASAEVSLARTSLIPDFALRFDYDREEEGSVFRRGLGVSLPLFNFGQGARGQARARRERARIELVARRSAAAAELEGTRRAYEVAVAAAQQLKEAGLDRAREAEDMAQESYRAGKINLPSLLLVRRELLDGRREYADRLLAAVLAGIDLAVARGTLQ
jgi:cobalt-zinc-cadmium efflux system outer membrane protein